MFEVLHVRIRNIPLAFLVHVCGSACAKFLSMIIYSCRKKITHQDHFHVNFDISFFIRNISCLYLNTMSEMLFIAFKGQMHKSCVSNYLTTHM